MSKRFYWKKIKPILLTIAICCTFFLLLMAITSNRQGNLTIFVDRSSVAKSLSLSESNLLTNPQGKLYGPSIDNAWSLSSEKCSKESDSTCIPDDLYLKDGNNSGQLYIAYTFYLFNSGIDELDYIMKFNIENTSKGLDEAVRIRLYVNDELTTYAKKNSITNEEEIGTVAFESDTLVTSHTITDFAPKQVTKYSIVIWIEDDDVDCTNDKIGGSISLSISFSVLDLV